DGALILDTSDLGRARTFIASQSARAGASARSYRGVSYRATGHGVALAIVSEAVVLGSESAVRGVIDTAAGGAALTTASGYSGLAVGLGARAGTFGADVRALSGVLSQLSSSTSASGAQISVKGLLDGFLAPLKTMGADTPAARRDFQSWMTSAALFAGGSG